MLHLFRDLLLILYFNYGSCIIIAVLMYVPVSENTLELDEPSKVKRFRLNKILYCSQMDRPTCEP
jgi:hypothetical protein